MTDVVWPKEPRRGIRYTTPTERGGRGQVLQEGRRMVVLSATHTADRSLAPRERWTVRTMCVQRFPYGGRYRTVYLCSWPPFTGCVPGWPEDPVIPDETGAQLALFGAVA